MTSDIFPEWPHPVSCALPESVVVKESLERMQMRVYSRIISLIPCFVALQRFRGILVAWLLIHSSKLQAVYQSPCSTIIIESVSLCYFPSTSFPVPHPWEASDHILILIRRTGRARKLFLTLLFTLSVSVISYGFISLKFSECFENSPRLARVSEQHADGQMAKEWADGSFFFFFFLPSKINHGCLIIAHHQLGEIFTF